MIDQLNRLVKGELCVNETTQRDIDAVQRVIAAIRDLPPESQLRVIRTVAAFCGFDPDKLPALAMENLE